MFNPAPIVASMLYRQRQERQRKERELKIKEEKERKIKEEQRKYPFKNKVLNGEQIEIYPQYAVKLIKQYKTEENGQINILEEVYKTKEVLQCYRIKTGHVSKILQKVL